MKFSDLITYIWSDLYRYTGNCSFKSFMRYYFFGRGFHYSFWMRLTSYLSQSKLFLPLFIVARLNLYRLSTKYGVEISYKCKIGYGLYIGHFGCIVVSNDAVIGNNVNLSQGVSLGQKNRGKYLGAPIVMDSVYIGPGAKLVGQVKIASCSAIGANAVVTKSCDELSVLVGIPARMISNKGSVGYIQNEWNL